VARTLLSARWLGLTVLALVAVVAFVLLGRWQWTRTYRLVGYHPAAGASRLDGSSHPGQLLDPSAAGVEVTAVGRFDATHQYLVAGRQVAGHPVDWVLTPLRLGDGTTLAVVRGWVAVGAGAPAPPAGTVHLTGRLQLPDPPSAGLAPLDGAGHLDRVSTADLAGLVGGQLRDGYLVRTAQTPPDSLASQPVPPPAVAGSAGQVRQFHLQNALYTAQWFLFAAFVVFMWLRILRDDLSRTAPTAPAAPGVPRPT